MVPNGLQSSRAAGAFLIPAHRDLDDCDLGGWSSRRFVAILVPMLAALVLSCGLREVPSLDELDRLAQARNVVGLSQYLSGKETSGRSPFAILRTNGAYEVGRFGWHAVALKGVRGENYVVFTTALTSEDTGVLLFKREGTKLRFVPESNSFGVQLIRHDFDLKFRVASKQADLVDRMRLAPLNPEPGEMQFRMSPQYIVSSIANSKGEAVKFAQAGGVISAERPLREDQYVIRYSAKVDLPNYAGSIGEHEATLTNDYWYPMVGRQPVPFDLTIHAPKGWVGVGQGDLVETKETASETAYRYRMDLPCVFYSVTAAPFKSAHQSIHGKTYSCWSSRLSPAEMKLQTEFYAPVIEFYSQFAPFPFKGYGAIDSEVYGGGALEAYSFTTWGHGSLPAEDAHEPAHTWWGGIINNTYLKSFWNESFAVFSEGFYRRNMAIGNHLERQIAFIQSGQGNEAYNAAPMSDSGAEIGGVASALGYGKGSQVLQMLEQYIGTEAMMRALKGWIERFHGRTSDWGDFEAVVAEQNPSKDIAGFFKDWVQKPGYADLLVSDISYSSGKLTMHIGFRGEKFHMPIDILLEYPDGARKFVTEYLADNDLVEIQCERKPSIVSVDPWRRALRTMEASEEPISLNRLIRSSRVILDRQHPEYLPMYQGERSVAENDADLDGKFLIGHPESMPRLAALCASVGFKVSGTELTYDGTTIDLRNNAALAVVDLPGGKHCVIGIGKIEATSDLGRSRLALVDRLGRFLRGKTDPKTSGPLTYRIP